MQFNCFEIYTAAITPCSRRSCCCGYTWAAAASKSRLHGAFKNPHKLQVTTWNAHLVRKKNIAYFCGQTSREVRKTKSKSKLIYAFHKVRKNSPPFVCTHYIIKISKHFTFNSYLQREIAFAHLKFLDFGLLQCSLTYSNFKPFPVLKSARTRSRFGQCSYRDIHRMRSQRMFGDCSNYCHPIGLHWSSWVFFLPCYPWNNGFFFLSHSLSPGGFPCAFSVLPTGLKLVKNLSI